MKIRDAYKMVVPKSFDEGNQKFYGHLNKQEIFKFCRMMNIPTPSVSCYQAYVSTGIDVDDGQLKISMTTISYDRDSCESIVTPIDKKIEHKIRAWFKNWS